jgi:dGTPase
MNTSSEIEISHLHQHAPYAVTSASATGRRFTEKPCNSRTEFQRDRDRIIHCAAFRRLEYKTQVFINHEGDLYRTRLTHSLEVAQIARSVARTLRLNEDLTEAIALAHDLGHTAFGHAGQDALHQCMQDYGGFEHNFQSLRVVDKLEEKYPEFNGLNLMFDTREGILKHCSLKNAAMMGKLGERFIQRKQPSLEAQLTNIADEIAYNNHDIDDGLRSGLITLEQLNEIELFSQHYKPVKERFDQLNNKRIAYEVIRRMINSLVENLTKQTLKNIRENNISSLQDIRNLNCTLAKFSPSMQQKTIELKQFLLSNLYQHERVQQMSKNAKKIITELFDHYLKNIDALPREHKERALVKQQASGTAGLARVVADYIAGMTDRYAELAHQRII